VENALQKGIISLSPLFGVDLVSSQAWNGGLTSLKLHSYAGSWPLGCIYYSRAITSNCRLLKSASTKASGIQGMRGPILYTRGTPTCPAWKWCQNYWDAPSCGCASWPETQGRLHTRIAYKPLFDIVVKKLFGPQKNCQSLTLYPYFVFIQPRLLDSGIKFVGFRQALLKNLIEVFKRWSMGLNLGYWLSYGTNVIKVSWTWILIFYILIGSFLFSKIHWIVKIKIIPCKALKIYTTNGLT